MSTLSSIAMFSDVAQTTFDINIYYKKETRRRAYMDAQGSKRFKTVDEAPLPSKITLSKEMEFNADSIRYDIAQVYPANRVSKQASDRVNNLKKVVENHNVKFYITGTKLNFNLDAAVIETENGQQIKGIFYMINEKSGKLNKTYFEFATVRNTEDNPNDDVSLLYKGTKFTSKYKEIAESTRIIDDKTINTTAKIETKEDVIALINSLTPELKEVALGILNPRALRSLRSRQRQITIKEREVVSKLRKLGQQRDVLNYLTKSISTKEIIN
ncbi:hypothetical protein Q9X96_003453 [Vibrio vulnificus]|nr:hypothetical protein [Vibrio vulnificus]